MRVRIYLPLAGVICLTAANPVPAVNSVDEGPTSIFKRETCCPASVYPLSDLLESASIEVDGLEAVIQYGEDDKPLPDQLARRMLPALGRAVRTMSVEQLVVLRRNFRSSPVVPKSRSVYSPKFLDLKEKISFLGPSYDSGPKLSQKNPAIKSFMPGDTGLCVVDSKALTSEQVKVAQTEHIIEVSWVKDWLEVLYKTNPEIAKAILEGPFKMWTGYDKIGGRKATQQFVIDALMLNIGSNTDGTETMSILERDINIAKGNLFSGNDWPGAPMWKETKAHKPTAQMLFDKIHDVVLASEYVLHEDTEKKARARMIKLLRTLKTYDKEAKPVLKDVEGCSSVAQHFMDNIRGRFTGYNEYLPKVHEKNKKDWQGSKEKLVGCSDDLFGQLTTKVLALKVETVKIDEYLPLSLMDDAKPIKQEGPK